MVKAKTMVVQNLRAGHTTCGNQRDVVAAHVCLYHFVWSSVEVARLHHKVARVSKGEVLLAVLKVALHGAAEDLDVAAQPWLGVCDVKQHSVYALLLRRSRFAVILEAGQHLMVVDDRDVLEALDECRIVYSRLWTIDINDPVWIAVLHSDLCSRVLEDAVRRDGTAFHQQEAVRVLEACCLWHRKCSLAVCIMSACSVLFERHLTLCWTV